MSGWPKRRLRGEMVRRGAKIGLIGECEQPPYFKSGKKIPAPSLFLSCTIFLDDADKEACRVFDRVGSVLEVYHLPSRFLDSRQDDRSRDVFSYNLEGGFVGVADSGL